MMNNLSYSIENSLTNLRNFVEENSYDSFSIYRYLREHNPTLVSDLDSIKSYLLDDEINEKNKLSLIESLYGAMKESGLQRKHEKNGVSSPYLLFKSKYSCEDIDESKFKKFYDSISGLKLKHSEIQCVDKSYRLLKCLEKLNIGQEKKLQFLTYAMTNTLSVEKMLEFFETEIDRDLQKEFNLCLRTNKIKVCSDTAFLVISNEINDYELENKCVYYQITSEILNKHEGNISLFYNANPFFINKIANDKLLKGKQKLFVLDNPYLVEIYSALYKDLSLKFVLLDDLDIFLVSNKYFAAVSSVFANHIDLDENIFEFINVTNKYLFNDSSIFVFGSDERIDAVERGIKPFALSKNYFPKEAFIFPSEIKNATTPQRKVLLSLSNDAFNRLDYLSIYSYGLENKNNNQILRLRAYVSKATFGDYRTKRCRTIYNENYNDSKSITNETRQSSYSYDFSKEIKVYYTISPIKNSKYNSINIYLKHPYLLDEETNEIVFETGYKFEESKIQVTNIPVCDIESFINNEYFYKKKRSNKNFQSIRSDVSQDYLLVYSEKSITLKTLVLLYEEFEKDLNDEDKALLYEIINDELGWVETCLISSKTINDYLDNKYYRDCDELQKQIAKKLISKLLDFAIEKGHAIDNPIKKEIKYINYDRKGIYDVRNARYKSSISLNFISKLIKNELEKLSSSPDLSIGLLIKILTPLSYREICALKFMDIFKSEHFTINGNNFYYLKIKRSIDNDFNYVQLDNLNDYRSIPIPNILAEVLQEQKLKLINSNPSINTDVINEYPIIAGNKNTGDLLHKVESPSRLSDYCKKALKKIGIKNDFVDLHTASGIETINLTFNKSDLLRNNFRYYAIFNGYFTEDELEFVCGNKATTVFSNNYCDYNNEASLYQLYIKQERIATTFLKDSAKIDKRYIYKNGDLKVLSNSTWYPSYINIEVLPQEKQNLEIMIENEFGFDFSESEIEIKEGE